MVNMNDINFWNGKRVLVGGGCGFLGSYLVPQLVEAGAHLTVVDNMINGYIDNLNSVMDQIQLVECDLRELDVCNRVTREQDIVINLSAKAFGMDYSRRHHGEMLIYNLLSTLTPLEMARMNDVERYVIVSSSCVYPDDAVIPTPELDVFTGRPESVNEGYGWAKRIQELAGSYYANDYGIKITIVRPFNLYGGNYRWRSEEKAHVIPALVKRIMDGNNPVVVWGSGQQRRNFLHTSDAARLIMLIIEKDIGPIPVNIGYDDETTIADLAYLICDVAGVSPKIAFDLSKPEGHIRKGADASRLRQVTNDYIPRISLRAGITEMIEWYHKWLSNF